MRGRYVASIVVSIRAGSLPEIWEAGRVKVVRMHMLRRLDSNRVTQESTSTAPYKAPI